MAVQELSLPAVAQALADQHHRGRRVRVVLENTYSTPWSEQHEAELSPHLRSRRRQLLQLADRNHDGVLSPAEREAGDAVLILRRAGVPVIDDREDGSAGSGLMHSKYLVVDGRTVVTGSANWSAASWANNENSLWIRDMTLGAAYTAWFERVYTSATVFTGM